MERLSHTQEVRIKSMIKDLNIEKRVIKKSQVTTEKNGVERTHRKIIGWNVEDK